MVKQVRAHEVRTGETAFGYGCKSGSLFPAVMASGI
jgi:hypothetical protein